ncbi:putative integral membrane protein [Aspergillus niger]|uniref:Putative integral membrane protein n=1 Tax=Aspergillus niger TaxID=5061 RepID=A0A505HPG4_ASPNG|nr:putative integral membrane protein [Aspergillus niger]
MDLSSLEGPPIADTRFTVSPRRANVPSIRLDTSTPVSPISPLTPHDLPPRPSSTDAIFSPVSESEYSYALFQQEPEANPNPWQRCYSPQPPVTADEHDVSDLTPHQSPIPMLSTTTTTTVTTQAVTTTITTEGNRLVWLEKEKLWFLKPSPCPSPHLSPDYAVTTRPTPDAHYAPYRPSSFHGQVHLAALAQRRDVPPPYGRHILDRPLPPLPTDDSENEGSCGSRWTEVARRRANRAVSR